MTPSKEDEEELLNERDTFIAEIARLRELLAEARVALHWTAPAPVHAEVQTHVAVGSEFPNGASDPAEAMRAKPCWCENCRPDAALKGNSGQAK